MNPPRYPVGACRVKGKPGRYFGKYKEEKAGKAVWRKIPGGPFSEAINTKQAALEAAAVWYEQEIVSKSRESGTPAQKVVTWGELCDEYVREVKSRLRGAGSSRNDARKRAAFLKKAPLLSVLPLVQHDDVLVLNWFRGLVAEQIKRKGEPDAPRHPLTIRNIRREVRELYRFAQSRGYYPRDRANPADSDEIKAELRHLLADVPLREVMCPPEYVQRNRTGVGAVRGRGDRGSLAA